MRRTKIVATIGPASDDPETLARMVEAGMDVARLNFAHGTREEKARTAARIHTAADRAGRQVAILQDLPGPKLRIGPLHEDVVELKAGDSLTLVCGSEEPGDASRVSVPWEGLASAAASGAAGEELYLADGSVRLRIEAVREAECEIDVAVEVGGSIASRQGLNIPGELDELPAVPEEDIESFVRRPEDVDEVRRHTRSPLIAKIEKPQAVDNVEGIIRASDCVMVARGDLGIELRIEDVPMVQKRVLALAGKLARPSITATQMLEAMIVSSRPTRAEVTDVANAILDGTDALMLSQETAVGNHPVGAVAMMASIAERTEREAPYEDWNENRVRRITSMDDNPGDPAYTVAYNACAAARQLDLSALIIPTLSGRSARLVSAHRPEVPIYALSPGRETVRRCSLMWGVQGARMKRHEVTEELIADAVARVVELGWVRRGSWVGVTAGLPSGRPGTTSLFQVQEA
jgi:pyruvate kinase